MNSLYWNVYQNLEREVLAIADVIHIDDNQVNTYSMKIADLLVRTVTEVESISKDLYRLNGGSENVCGKYLHFDYVCLKYLNQIWGLSKKKVFLSSPSFYLENKEYLDLTPLVDAEKGKQNVWLDAYQAVKHDRANNLKKGSVKNLLQALAGLFVLNVYFKNESYSFKSGRIGEFDCSLGSRLFSIKVHPVQGLGLDNVYHKNDWFDECVYLCEYTDDAKNRFFDITKKMDARVAEIISGCMIEELEEKRIDFNTLKESDRRSLLDKYVNEARKQAHLENFREFSIAMQSLHTQYVLNKNQY